LKILLDYLSPSIQLNSGIADTIDTFEVRMYSILESAHKIDKDEIFKVTQIRNQITELMKELTMYKTTLRKSNNDQKDHLLNRFGGFTGKSCRL